MKGGNMAFEIFKRPLPKGRYGFLTNIQPGEIRDISIEITFSRLRKIAIEYMRKHNVVLSWEQQENGFYRVKRES